MVGLLVAWGRGCVRTKQKGGNKAPPKGSESFFHFFFFPPFTEIYHEKKINKGLGFNQKESVGLFIETSAGGRTGGIRVPLPSRSSRAQYGCCWTWSMMSSSAGHVSVAVGMIWVLGRRKP